MTTTLLSMLVLASGSWTVTTSDLKQLSGRVISATELTLRVESEGVPQDLAWGDVLALRADPVSAADAPGADAAPPPSPANWMVHLARNERIAARSFAFDDQSLAIVSENLGHTRIDLRRVRAMTRGGASVPPEPAEIDTLRLANGDVVEGIVESIGDETVAINTGSTSLDIPLAEVQSILLAELPDDGEEAEARYVLRLLDGSVMRVGAIGIVDDSISVQGLDQRVALAVVSGLDHLAGRAVWLDLPSVPRSEWTPYFEPLAEASTGSHAVGPGGGRFTLRSRSALTIDLDQSFRRLRASFAVPARHRMADTILRVEGDGRTLHTTDRLVAGSTGTLDLDVSNVQSLKLIVDFGGRLDVDDAVTFSDAVLFR